MDVFSRDDEDLGLVTDVFEDKGILEVLRLASPVEGIDSTAVFEVQVSPSTSPSQQDDITDGSPSQAT
jgi:hypothetical protein